VQIEALLWSTAQAWPPLVPVLVEALEPLEALLPPSTRRWCRA